MRETLIAFIRAVQNETAGGDFRHQFTVGSLFGTSAEGELPSISFGYGYYARENVLFTPGKTAECPRPVGREMPVEEAVDAFLGVYKR